MIGDVGWEDEDGYLFIMARTDALAVEAADDSLGQWWKGQYTLAEFHERLKSVPTLETAVIQDAGHMLHHDQPQTLAALLQKFLA